MERIVTKLKIPLDERALDRLTLGSGAAVIAYQEQRLKLQAARKLRDNLQRDDLVNRQFAEEDDIA